MIQSCLITADISIQPAAFILQPYEGEIKAYRLNDCKWRKMRTSNVCCGMVGLTVHTEAALFHSPQLLQLLVQQIYGLLHTLPLGHGHLAHTAR